MMEQVSRGGRMEAASSFENSGFSSVPVGEQLRQARLKAKLEISDIAERTRIPARHLLAIEEGRYASLPALAYSTGFAKAFATAVNLDPAVIGAAFRAEAAPDPISPFESYEPIDPARVPSRKLAWIGALVALLIVVLLGAYGAGLFESRPAPEATPVAAGEGEVPPAIGTVNPSPDGGDLAAADQAAQQPPAMPASAPQPVVIRATEEAWLKVYDRSGQTVKMGILKPGESYEVPGDPSQLLLWTGKAGALQVTVGGKAVPPLGGPVETVRDVSLAPASLLGQQPQPTAPDAAAPQGGAE